MFDDVGPEPRGTVRRRGSLTAKHWSSHRGLLQRSGSRSQSTVPPAVDAVVVAAARPAYNLTTAMQLAAAARSTLVVMCSANAKPAEVAGLVCEVPGLRAVVVDLSAGYDDSWFDLKTSTVTEAVPGHLGDLSLKRNLGLLLAGGMGWKSLLSLDDDIRRVSPALVGQAAVALGRNDAVGMPARSFPDNSVVCHASRLGGRPQGVFASGSALLVDPNKMPRFFPRVYNEDWLFMYDSLSRQRIAVTGQVTQEAYHPFADPNRAAAEEFGDVLAEGLMSLLHHATSAGRADVFYWRQFLEQRRLFIETAAARIDRRRPFVPGADQVLAALERAEQARGQLSAELLEDYTTWWRSDLAGWSAVRAEAKPGRIVRSGHRLDASLRRLRLDAITQTVSSTKVPSPRREGQRSSVLAVPRPSEPRPSEPYLSESQMVECV